MGGGSLITFTVDGVEYQAKEGMTWGEWCNSEYDNERFYIELDNRICTKGGFGQIGGYWIGTEEYYVFSSDIIQKNYNYLLVG